MSPNGQITVKVSTSSKEWPLARQTPGRSGVWGNCRFFINEEIEQADFWFVIDGLTGRESCWCPPGNVVLVTGEPPTVKRYAERYLAQFAAAVTSHDDLPCKRVIKYQQALPWMVGGRFLESEKRWHKEFSKDYDELTSMAVPEKEKLLSIILSNKTGTPGHKQRMEFVARLQDVLHDQLDVYGVGIRSLSDKWDGVAPYKYFLALENAAVPHYWTEKLSDALLGYAYPIYFGCPNIGDYFESDGMSVIDISNVDLAVEAVVKLVHSDTYERSLPGIRKARDLVIGKYNIFALMAEFCSGSSNSEPSRQVVLSPESHFRGNVVSRIARRVSAALRR